MTADDHPIVPTGGATRDGTAVLLTPDRIREDCKTTCPHPGSTDRTRSAAESGPENTPKDFPTPRAVEDTTVYDWHEDRPPVENFAGLGRRLREAGDLYRTSGYGGGLLLASSAPHVPPTPITDAAALDPLITDRQRVRVIKGGNVKAWSVPSRQLKTMLASEAFLQQFLPVDAVERAARYLPDFSLTRPGYNDGGYGQRVLHVGGDPGVEFGRDTITRFIDVMEFASEADRTNAVAAGLTVMLRHHWPGGKPCLVVTSTKSHGGKETVVVFACGTTPSTSISYQATDWALERAFIGALKYDPEVGLIDVENARLQRGQKWIASGFLERFITDPQPLLFSTGTGPPVRRRNDIVVAITTNFGTISEDKMNRGLPIHLDPVGDVAARCSPIGNPKLEYLPANRERIGAELRGMIEKWKREGRPLDTSVRHPFGPWAQTVGGILMVNALSGFLGNYAVRKTADDPLRRGLSLLGSARPDAWLRSADWAGLARGQGLVKAIIPEADRGSDLGHERGIGAVLSAHRGETFHAETEDRRLVLTLEKGRRRFVAGEEPQTRYRFVVTREEEIPEELSG